MYNGLIFIKLNFNGVFAALEGIQIFVICYLVGLGNKVQIKYKLLLSFHYVYEVWKSL